MPRYRVKAGHKHHIREPGTGKGLITRHEGEIVEMEKSTYEAFSDKFDYVGPSEEPRPVSSGVGSEPPKAPKELSLRLVSGNNYNIIHPETNQPINEKPLPLEQAKAMLAQAKTEVESKEGK